jgi:anti-anti-sigma factor
MTADLKPTGRFDEAFAAEAKPTLEKLAQLRHDITIDMSETADMNCAGLGALVYLYKQLAPQGFKVRVVGANGNLRRLFERFEVAGLFIGGEPGTGGSALLSGFFGLAPDASVAAGAGAANKSGPDGSQGGAPKRAIPVTPRFDAASHSVKVWLDTATVAATGELRGGDALKSYRRWARKLGQDVSPTEFRKHLAAILGPGYIMPRTSGYILRGIRLRSVLERGKKPAAATIRLPRGLFAEPTRMDAIAALSF